MNLLDRLNRAQADGKMKNILERMPCAQDAIFSWLEARVKALGDTGAEMSGDMIALSAHIGGMHVFSEMAGEAKLTERMRLWAKCIVNACENAVSAEEMIQSLTDFDEREMLKSEEIWNAPQAIRKAASEAFISCAIQVVRAQEARLHAEKWASRSHMLLAYEKADNAFFAHAFKITSENGDARKHEALMQRVRLVGRSEADCIRLAQDAETNLIMRMDHLAAVCRVLESVDWEEVFTRVSFTEKMLMTDPSCVYLRMDTGSRETIRREVACIARKTGCAERMVASLAVECTGDSEGVCDILYTDEGRGRLMKKIGMAEKRIPRIVPDEKGHRLIFLTVFAFLAVEDEPLPLERDALMFVMSSVTTEPLCLTILYFKYR